MGKDGLGNGSINEWVRVVVRIGLFTHWIAPPMSSFWSTVEEVGAEKEKGNGAAIMRERTGKAVFIRGGLGGKAG